MPQVPAIYSSNEAISNEQGANSSTPKKKKKKKKK